MRLEGKWMKEFIFTRTGAQDEQILGYAYVKRWLSLNYVCIINALDDKDAHAYLVTDSYFDFIDNIFKDDHSYYLSYQSDAIFIEPAEPFIIRRCTLLDEFFNRMDVHPVIYD